MLSTRHSLSKLKFFQFSCSFEDELNTIKENIEYHFSPFNVAKDKALFNALLKAEDDRFPLDLIHSAIEDYGFSFEDLVNFLELTSVRNISRLGKKHFELGYRLHTIYWALVINIQEVLNFQLTDDLFSWVKLVTIAGSDRALTNDFTLMKTAISSSVPKSIEVKIVDNDILIRNHPVTLDTVRENNYIFGYTSCLEPVIVDSPLEYKSSIMAAAEPPGRLYRSPIQNAYKPQVFIPNRLHIDRGSLIVSTKELYELFPDIEEFRVRKAGYFLIVENHFPENIKETLVELLSIQLRVIFCSVILDASLAIYDCNKYDLVWSAGGYSLHCRQFPHVHTSLAGTNQCIPSSVFLDSKLTIL